MCLSGVIFQFSQLPCSVWAMGQHYLHLGEHRATKKAILSAYYSGGKQFDVNADQISAALKLAARALEYPILKGISIECINTHFLRSGGAHALALAGYSDTQIHKKVGGVGPPSKCRSRMNLPVSLPACLMT